MMNDKIQPYPPILAVDFDGTITRDNDFPNCGELMPGAKEVLKELHELGCIVILYTCRVGQDLVAAVKHCRHNKIPIDYVNRNIPQIEGKYAYPKIFANYYIDDLNLGGFPGWERVKEIVLQDPYFIHKKSDYYQVKGR